MPPVQDDHLTVEQLLLAVKQLSPADLHEFTRQFLMLLRLIGERNGEQISRSGAKEETALLACIEENSRLPVTEQRRYEQLRRKCEDRTLSESELAEYQSLLQKLEARNVKRIEALIALVKRRRTTLRGIMAELKLKGADDVF